MYLKNQLALENKRRGWTISIAVHALLLLIGIIPFLVEKQEPSFAQAITIQFDDNASKASGASGGRSSSAPAREQVAFSTLNSVQPSQPLPQPKVTMPVITAPNPDIQVTESRTAFFDESLQTSEYEGSGNEPAPLSAPTQGAQSAFSSDAWDGAFDGDSEGEVDPFAAGIFEGKWPGELDGTEGTTVGVGEDGKGKYWGEFAGDGLFNRKVIKRADVAKIAIQEGRVVVNLCVNQAGEVVYAECDKSKTTIKEPTIVAKSELCAANYVFDRDPTAPAEQCGKLTFIFKIEK